MDGKVTVSLRSLQTRWFHECPWFEESLSSVFGEAHSSPHLSECGSSCSGCPEQVSGTVFCLLLLLLRLAAPSSSTCSEDSTASLGQPPPTVRASANLLGLKSRSHVLLLCSVHSPSFHKGLFLFPGQAPRLEEEVATLEVSRRPNLTDLKA